MEISNSGSKYTISLKLKVKPYDHIECLFHPYSLTYRKREPYFPVPIFHQAGERPAKLLPQKQTMGDKDLKIQTCFCLGYHMSLFYPRSWQSLPFSATPSSGKQACEQLQSRLEKVCAQGARVFLLVFLPQSRYTICLSKYEALIYLTYQNLPTSVPSVGTVHPDPFHGDQILHMWCRELLSCLICASHSPGAPHPTNHICIPALNESNIYHHLWPDRTVPHPTGLSLALHSPDIQEAEHPLLTCSALSQSKAEHPSHSYPFQWLRPQKPNLST